MEKHDLRRLAAHEAESRFIRHTSVPIVEYSTTTETSKGLVLAPAGSVMIYVAHKGSDVMRQLRDIKKNGDTEIAQKLYDQFKDRPLLTPDKAWMLLENSPVFADIRYGGRTLATNVFIPNGLEAVWVGCPYNGGKLAVSELTLVEHYKEDSQSAYEAVALMHRPDLTAAEAAALKAVPESQLELNLAPNGSCCDSVTDVLQVIIAATFAIMCNSPIPDFTIYESDIKKLTPTAAAIQLMNVRREALGHYH
jgi:hypothetical protein